MRCVELFSGCGGLAMGLGRSGFVPEVMLEWNVAAVATVLHNRDRGVPHVVDWPIRQQDVREARWDDLRGRVELVAGGPPCQPFSIGGKGRGHEDGRDMWPSAIRAVRELDPRAFVFENVKGLLRPAFRDYLEWIVGSLERPWIAATGESRIDALARLREIRERAGEIDGATSISYRVAVMGFNAADYGAAQRRHRVMLVGIRADLGIDPIPPCPTHSRERLLWDQWCSGAYWERHGLAQPGDERINRTDIAMVRRLRSSDRMPNGKPWMTLRDAIQDLGEPRTDYLAGALNHLPQPGARSYPGHTGSVLDQPAKALKAGVHGVPGGENMLVRDDGSVRYLTIREAARLQGMPDEYRFPGSWSEAMRQLGNAVPVQVAEVVGGWIADMLQHGADDRIAA